MKHYRKNAGVVLFNSDRKVLLCERVGNYENAWQFPQGGIDAGETAAEAAARELYEETSVKSAKLVKTLETPFIYDFPPEIVKRNALRGRFDDGNEQYWSLFFFTGKDSEINLATAEPEFKNWKWAEITEADKHVIAFKKPAYEQLIKLFKPLIDGYRF